MLDKLQAELRQDCLASLENTPDLARRIARQRIAVIGGTGFAGTWLAEMVQALNTGHGAGVRLDLFGRSGAKWSDRHPHLRSDAIAAHTLDARSPFDLPRDTTLVINAVGIADPRVLASEPQRVFQTTVFGLDNALTAANRLEGIQHFVNVSSGLVSGGDMPARALTEQDIGVLDFTRQHNVYAEARRAGESLASGFASQYRLPLSTVRAFTFLGPYQGVDAPWAANNFIRDALAGHEIRVNGDGSTRRSYLYGSDVAVWLLQACLNGTDGAVYQLGGDKPVSHAEVATLVASRTVPQPNVQLASLVRDDQRSRDFFPDLTHTRQALGVVPTVALDTAIERTMAWYAALTGQTRRLRG